MSFFKFSNSSLLNVTPLPIFSWFGAQSRKSNLAGLPFQLTKFNSLRQPFAFSDNTPISSKISYENSISIDYLSRLNERYEAWIHTYDKGKLLIIDVDNINFVDNPEHLGEIINRIDAEINGLF